MRDNGPKDNYEDDRGERGGLGSRRRKVSPFYAEFGATVDYRDPSQLRHFIADHGKILPRRISKLTAKHQRLVTRAVKRARSIGLIPFTNPTA